MVNAPEVQANKEDVVDKQEETTAVVNGVDATATGNGVVVEPPEVEATVESTTELLTRGKRDLFCNNVTQAVDLLSECCAQLDKVYGEGHVSCARGYFWYGTALLDLARMERGVLGNALQGVPADESMTEGPDKIGERKEKAGEGEGVVVVEDVDGLSERERSEVRELVADALEEAFSAAEEAQQKQKQNENKNNENSSDADKKQTETGEEKEEEEEEEDMEAGKENEAEEERDAADDTAENENENEEQENGVENEQGDDGNENGEDVENIENEDQNDTRDDEDDDEDDDSLKLSWQMLDWARKLVEAASDQQLEDRTDLLAQCFLKLGENLTESSHHSEAEAEFKKCIEVYEAAVAKSPNGDKPFERALAEAYFMAGLNLIDGNNYTNAVNYFESAISIIKRRVASAERKLEASTDAQEKEDLSEELKQLKDILPSIEEKIQDAKVCADKMTSESERESVQEVSALKQAMKEVEMKEAEEMNGGKSMDAEPAKSINHLVKRKSPLKEKPVEHNQEEDLATKRKGETVSEMDSVPSKKAKLDSVTTEDDKKNTTLAETPSTVQV